MDYANKARIGRLVALGYGDGIQGAVTCPIDVRRAQDTSAPVVLRLVGQCFEPDRLDHTEAT